MKEMEKHYHLINMERDEEALPSYQHRKRWRSNTVSSKWKEMKEQTAIL